MSTSIRPDSLETLALFYLARGADENAMEKFVTFRDSYAYWPSSMPHDFFIIYKGFSNASTLAQARDVFRNVLHTPLYFDDEGYDLGAYFKAASRVDRQNVCFLNTASRICGPDWLLKLAMHLTLSDVGMVSGSASYEAPQHPGQKNMPFPNPHLRTNAFLIRRQDFLEMRPAGQLTDKLDVYRLEHGSGSFTRRIWSQGRKALLVGRNGRGYDPESWFKSQSFRQGAQPNLLVADNQTSAFEQASIEEKRGLYRLAWGDVVTRSVGDLAMVATPPEAAPFAKSHPYSAGLASPRDKE